MIFLKGATITENPEVTKPGSFFDMRTCTYTACMSLCTLQCRLVTLGAGTHPSRPTPGWSADSPHLPPPRPATASPRLGHKHTHTFVQHELCNNYMWAQLHVGTATHSNVLNCLSSRSAVPQLSPCSWCRDSPSFALNCLSSRSAASAASL